jgi:uncharacterized protein with ParB-like and HNH nuclease domain
MERKMQNHQTSFIDTEIQYLNVILRRIDNGELQIPAFQRRFIWKAPQVISLLESVYKGFPIGSILLWETDNHSVESKSGPTRGTSRSLTRNTTTFILDGVQRLTALYRSLLTEEVETQDTIFRVAFDLRNEKFKKVVTEENIKPYELLMSSLFASQSFFDTQERLLAQKDSQQLIEKYNQLHKIFQQYTIPVITIGYQNPDDVFEIFRMLNTTGTQLKREQLEKNYRWLLQPKKIMRSKKRK